LLGAVFFFGDELKDLDDRRKGILHQHGVPSGISVPFFKNQEPGAGRGQMFKIPGIA